MRPLQMIDFVLQKEKFTSPRTLESTFLYAHFLKQKIELGMFVVCDANNAPLTQPNHYFRFKNENWNGKPKMSKEWIEKCEEYQKAEKKVIFKDFFIAQDEDEDGKLCLFHPDSRFHFAIIEPKFIWGRTNQFTIADIIDTHPRLASFTFNMNATNQFL